MTGDKILIVDDEATNVEIFDLMLSKLGFSTDTASDGVEALEKLPSFRPALPSGSERRRKFSCCSVWKRFWSATESRLTPKTSAPIASNDFAASRSEQTSRVHPGVSAFG